MKYYKKVIAWIGAAINFCASLDSPAHAASASVGTLLSSAKNDLSPLGLVGCFAFAGIGLFFFGTGVMKLRGNRGGGGAGDAAWSIVIGLILISLTAIILAFSATFTNSGASSGLSKLGIGN